MSGKWFIAIGIVLSLCTSLEARRVILNVTERNAIIGRNDVPPMSHTDILIVEYSVNQPTSIEFNLASIKVVPRGVFSKDSVKNFICTNTRIARLEETDFSDGDNLQSLTITRNPLTSITDNTFKKLTKLQNLNLDGNQITTIQSKAFTDLIKLKELRVSSNRISTLPRNVFDDLISLEVLVLQANQLQTFDPSLLSNQRNLQTLNVAANRLTEFNLPDLKALKKLQVISFFNNRISFIDVTNIKVNMPKLTQIYATNNKWSCEHARNISDILQSHHITHMLSGGCVLDKHN